MDEVFRPIEGYERLYEVSNMGRVRSLKYGKKKILKPVMTKFGYLRVGLHKEGKQKLFFVHRLVTQAFIPNPEGLPQINHIDEDKTNNVVDNLEWCDHRYNMNYGTRIERSVQTGIRNGTYDPELCGLTEKERKRLYYQKNKERLKEYQREYDRRKKTSE